MNDKKLTIIVLTYYSAHIIKECLSKLNFDLYKIVVVDNASQDTTISIVQEHFPKAEIIRLNKNIGYGNGNNVALEQIDTQFALILNPDAFISKEDIENILAVMQSNNRIALAGPLLFNKYPAPPHMIESRMGSIIKDINGLKKYFYKKLSDDCYSVLVIFGCIAFLNMNVFRKIGFFDKNIFLYIEDNELSDRVVKNGYINALITNSYGYHEFGKSSKPSLRILYLRSWHLGWSRLYFQQIRRGFISSKISALGITLRCLIVLLATALLFESETFVRCLGTASGSFSFLIGLRAFNKNGTGRG